MRGFSRIALFVGAMAMATAVGSAVAASVNEIRVRAVDLATTTWHAAVALWITARDWLVKAFRPTPWIHAWFRTNGPGQTWRMASSSPRRPRVTPRWRMCPST